MLVTEIDFNEIAYKHRVPVSVVRDIWYNTFKFIYEKASSFNLMDTTDEELDNMKTDFVLPNFGILRVNKKRLRNRTAATKARIERGKQLYPKQNT